MRKKYFDSINPSNTSNNKTFWKNIHYFLRNERLHLQISSSLHENNVPKVSTITSFTF